VDRGERIFWLAFFWLAAALLLGLLVWYCVDHQEAYDWRSGFLTAVLGSTLGSLTYWLIKSIASDDA